MDGDHFDSLARLLGAAAPRRVALGGLLGAALVALRGRFAGEDAVARKKHHKKKHKKKPCKGGKKTCGKHCIPRENCCQDADCGENEKCTGGACEPCLPQGADCTDDAQCCTGICDSYTNRCQQVRVACTSDDQCPGGQCCSQFGGQCLYETATQLECEPEVSCGYLVCGDACSDLDNGTYEFCGFEGSAACRKGRCCCPQGIPIEDCPNLMGPGNLPRCS